MENEEKKQGKYIYPIRLSLTCHQPRIPTKTKKNKQIQNRMISHIQKEKVEAVNRNVTKEVAFQNLAIF